MTRVSQFSQEVNDKSAVEPKPAHIPGDRPYSSRTGNTALARLLIRQGIRRMTMCAHLGISERQGYNIMSRARPLSIPQLHRLCDLLDVGAEDIVDESLHLLTVEE